MTKPDFISTEEWPAESIDDLLELARRVKRGEVSGGLEKQVLAMIFLDPSLRTRSSMETAMFLHGGHALVLEPGKGSWSLETEPGVIMDGAGVEHLIDAARVLSRYAGALAVRSFPKGTQWSVEREDRIIRNFAKYCDKPVINLESVRRHPCQGLADMLTLKEKLGETRGKKFVLQWAWHPKPLPTAVPVSAALAAAHLGMEVAVVHPPGFELDAEDMQSIAKLAEARGGQAWVTHDRDSALDGAAAVYVKSWGALSAFGRPEEERSLRVPFRDWRMSDPGRSIVMHCLPVRRNVEIDDAVLDGPQSAVYDQAENRLHVQRALLLALLGKE
jgi:N-acetylornithine carbamoyltransferase